MAVERSKKRSKKRSTKKGDPLRGRFSEHTAEALDRINRSYPIDRRLWREDIEGSLAHARMLGAKGILSQASVKRIVKGLLTIHGEFEARTFKACATDEDIHMAVERRLVELIGDDGARLHTGRSRNDQVATDLELYCARAAKRIQDGIRDVQAALVSAATDVDDALVPFYTHMQRAQPIVMAHVLLAYVEMLQRDTDACAYDLNACPLGSGAGAGTTYPIDRAMTAKALGFRGPSRNSLVGVSSRQNLARLLSGFAATATTLSRLGGDIILWTTREFGFARLGDDVSTGSSIMPQKRNPDGAELLRGKASRVIGALQRVFEIQRGLPMGYFKDLQEDKAALFDAEDTLLDMLAVASAMMRSIDFDRVRMEAAVAEPSGYLMATEAADYLVSRGVSFREAHEAVGALVRLAETRDVGLEALDIDDFRRLHRKFDDEVFTVLDPLTAVRRRRAIGGPSPANVRRELARWRKRIASSH